MFSVIVLIILSPFSSRAWAPVAQPLLTRIQQRFIAPVCCNQFCSIRRTYPNGNKKFLVRNRSISSSSSSSTSTLFGSSRNLISLEESLDLFGKKEDGEGKVVFVDASYYHKGNRNGRQEFEDGPRIEGAKYMDIDDIATSKDLFPERNPQGLYHMLPPPDLFAAAMDAFNITNPDRIIIYGKHGSIFTPRTWFLFKTMGHEKVSLLQASLEEWIEAGGPVDTRPTVVTQAKDLDLSKPTSYQARDNPIDVCSMNEMLGFVEENESIILDPRGSSFGKGHIPGTLHVPYSTLVSPDNKLKLKSKDELEAIFENAGIDVHTDKRIVCTCGSGISVCHVYLALRECGRTGEILVYDGSWNEWSQNPNAPKVVPSESSSIR